MVGSTPCLHKTFTRVIRIITTLVPILVYTESAKSYILKSSACAFPILNMAVWTLPLRAWLETGRGGASCGRREERWGKLWLTGGEAGRSVADGRKPGCDTCGEMSCESPWGSPMRAPACMEEHLGAVRYRAGERSLQCRHTHKTMQFHYGGHTRCDKPAKVTFNIIDV